MSQHIGSRIVTATGGSIKRVGNYKIHTFPSEVVTDGLVFNFDAADPASFPSQGSTVFDLSSNGHNGTISGASYSTADGGVFDFDGSNDQITTTTGILRETDQYFTVEQWLRYDSSNPSAGSPFGYGKNPDVAGNYAFVVHGQVNTGFYAFTSDGSAADGSEISTGTLTNGSWYHLVWLVGPGAIKLYKQGVNTSNATTTHTSINIRSDGAAVIGRDVRYGQSGTNRHFKGGIAVTRLYNRWLSDSEISQNYDAWRVRYGNYTANFTPVCEGNEGKVEVLCVAGGGGGGGGDVGSGGGAGGLVYNSAFTVNSNTAVSLSVGKGGRGSAVSANQASDGDNTTFGSLTATGGGGGNGWGQTSSGNAGRSGGSGGGGRTGGAGTAGQGFAGGSDSTLGSPNYPQGGGGGAGGVGQDAYRTGSAGTEVPGDGGAGLQYSVSGELKYYAGGGGGAIESAQNSGRPTSKGGSGVGGNGGRGTPSQTATNGVPNTGSGGGGDDSGTGVGGGNGSNGVVIVRYPAEDYNVEVLVVGGGGGGGSGSQYAYSGGGGGAGGFIYRSKLAVSSGENMKVSVGKGGAGASGYDPAPFGKTGTSGTNSRFGNLIAIGGGAGGGGLTYDGVSGGSGGGGGGRGSDGGAGTTGQGFAGGNSSDHGDTTTYAAGGGGASSAGGNGSNTTTAAGGEGKANSITGSSVTYSVGGAGGNNNGTGSGTPVTNSGSGGRGGVGNGGSGTTGADGIVVVVYKGPQRGIGGTIDTTSRPGYTIHKFTSDGNFTFIP